MIMTLRVLIVATYIVGGLVPWLLFFATGFWLFGVIGVAFTALLIALLPMARRDWNYAR